MSITNSALNSRAFFLFFMQYKIMPQGIGCSGFRSQRQ